jgi:hypothetical protein
MNNSPNSVPSSAQIPDEPQKLLIYIMPDKGPKGGHKFMVIRRTTKNAKGRYVTGDEFEKFGLFWPNSLFNDRDDLALAIGRSILAEANL